MHRVFHVLECVDLCGLLDGLAREQHDRAAEARAAVVHQVAARLARGAHARPPQQVDLGGGQQRSQKHGGSRQCGQRNETMVSDV